MSQGRNLPKFGPPDSEGFQTVSFYDPDGAEIARVSLHIKRQQRYLEKTSGDVVGQYSPDEQQSLRTAAAILAAQKEAPEHDPERALAAILEFAPQFIASNFETHFPPLAYLAIQVASDACVKFTITGLVQSQGGPRVYDDNDVELILKDLKTTVREFLKIDVGRPVETSQQLQRTKEALERLDKREHFRESGKRPTQQQVAEELEVEPRTLRLWQKTCDLDWDEWLRASGWNTQAEGN